MRRATLTFSLHGLQPLSPVFPKKDFASTHLALPEPDIHPVGSIAITNKGCIHIVDLKDILYVEADSNYTRFYTQGVRCFMMAKTLKQVSQKLIMSGFLRIHQSFLVHPSMIRQYIANPGEIVLKNGCCIPVSRANRKWLADQLMCFSC